MVETNKPILALTMGDPAGVGPEVIARAWADPQVHEHARPIVVGHPQIIARAAKLIGLNFQIRELHSADEFAAAPSGSHVMPLINVCSDEVAAAPVGCVDARAGE